MFKTSVPPGKAIVPVKKKGMREMFHHKYVKPRHYITAVLAIAALTEGAPQQQFNTAHTMHLNAALKAVTQLQGGQERFVKVQVDGIEVICTNDLGNCQLN